MLNDSPEIELHDEEASAQTDEKIVDKRYVSEAQHNHSSRVNLKSFVLACIGQLIFNNDDSASIGFEQDYLLQYYRQFRHTAKLKEALDAYLLNVRNEDYYLLELANKLNLNHIELLTISLALCVEEDPMVGRNASAGMRGGGMSGGWLRCQG